MPDNKEKGAEEKTASVQATTEVAEAVAEPVKNADDLKQRLADEERAVLLIGRGDSTIFTTIRKS